MQASPHPWPAPTLRPLLGANGTEAMLAVLADGDGALVDYLKVGPFMGRPAIAVLAAQYPLLLHLDDTLSGHTLPAQEMLERVRTWVQLTGTPWTSEHIGFSVADVDLDGALITQAASSLLSREQARTNIIRNARHLAAHLPVPLLLENIPLYPNLAHMWVCEPELVSEVIAEAGCDLLLDLAHARVSADVLGLDVHDYLARLPLERTLEIHLSGPRANTEFDPRRRGLVTENARSVAHLVSFADHNLVDAHAPLRVEDYTLLEWTLERVEPRAVSLEYFYEPGPLREQLVRLNKILGR